MKRKSTTSKGADATRGKLAISPLQWEAAKRNYLADGRADAAAIEALDWLWNYGHQELGGDRHRMAELAGYDWTVLHKIFHGTYEAGLVRFVEGVNSARKRAESAPTGLIDTPVTERIFKALDYARDMCRMVLICGPTGRSKTSACKAWRRLNNHGRSVYVRCSSSASRVIIVRDIAKALGFGTRGKKTRELEERIMSILDPRRVLILDEPQALMPMRRAGGTKGIEFIRDLHDICGCAVALVMTPPNWDEAIRGPMADYLEQFVGRIGYTLRIPDDLFRDEITAICAHYVPEPPEEMIQLAAEIAKAGDGKLRTLFDDLSNASRLAKGKGETMTTRHLALARKWRLAGGAWKATKI